MRYYGVQNEVKAYCNRLQNETSITVTPSLVKTLNDRVESLKKSGVWSQFSLGFNDNDGDAYLQRANVTDILGRSEVLWFVRGMKCLGLWQNMVCWPLRSYQNAGTGSTAYSLGGLGTFNGTIMNSPTWGSDGLVFVFNLAHNIVTNAILQVRASGGVYKTTGGGDRYIWGNISRPNWSEGTTLKARVGNDNLATVDIAGPGLTSPSRIRAQTTPVFNRFVFTQATHTAPGSSTAPDTTIRHDKGTVIIGTTLLNGGGDSSVGVSTLPIRLAARRSEDGQRYFEGEMTLVYLVVEPITPSQQGAIYDLYKQTLGSNLSLP